jgi:hypothetical protein
MDFGCRIWDEDGNLILNTTDYTARLVYSTIKAGDSSGSEYVAEADGTKPFVMVAPARTGGSGNCLTVGVTEWGTLTWEPMIGTLYDPEHGYYEAIVSEETLILIYVCDEKI